MDIEYDTSIQRDVVQSRSFTVSFDYIKETGKGTISYNVLALNSDSARKKASVQFLEDYRELRKQ